MNRTTLSATVNFFRARLAATLTCALLVSGNTEAQAQRKLEHLGRGVVAINQGEGKVFVSWRLLGTEPDDLAFNVYRTVGDSGAVKLNPEPLTGATHFTDNEAKLEQPTAYFVRAVLAGKEQESSTPFKFAANAPARPYLSIPLKTPVGYSPNDLSVGDLDGEGEYELIVHMTGRGRDNSQAGLTDPPIFQAYKLDGTMLWQINLGKNIREGAHYTQFMVYDLDGDGRAEMVCKTADGTVDGAGKVIGDANADWRQKAGTLVPSNDRTGSVTAPDGSRAASTTGYILDGPEFLTVFDGLTGKALATTDYIPARGKVADWGDGYGNRVDRFVACVAYLDGQWPSVVMCRGYYTRTTLVAWDWRDGKLTQRWFFDSAAAGAGQDGKPNRDYAGQGNHGLSVADVDGDGKDEIIYGAMCVDDNGQGLWTTGLRHGDALHVSDLDPARPGLEIFGIHEGGRTPGAALLEARTGKILWATANADVGRGLAADVDPAHPGAEFFGGPGGSKNVKGETIPVQGGSNFAVWWDGDLLRELLNGNAITKWNWEKGAMERILTAEGCTSNNGSKSTPALSADLLGDWREEVILRTTENKELRIFTTTIPTKHRLPTLMHDPQYRLAIAWQNVAYNQPPHPGFFLGDGMTPPPRPNITTKKIESARR